MKNKIRQKWAYSGIGEEFIPRSHFEDASDTEGRHRRADAEDFNAHNKVTQQRHSAKSVDNFTVRAQPYMNPIWIALNELSWVKSIKSGVTLAQGDKY